MNRRQVIAIAGIGLSGLAGCTSESQEPDSDDTGDGAESEPAADFTISNVQLNGVPIDGYDVEFPADASPEQVADEFEHELQYDTEGASGSVESTITVEYTDRTIPEDPLNREITSDQYNATNSIEQEIQFPDDLVEHLIDNPRNIQATLTVEDTEQDNHNQEFTLNYADNYVEQIHREAFRQETGGTFDRDLRLGNIVVNQGLIDFAYESENKVGTDEFNKDLSAGLYSGVVGTTRIPYEIIYTIHDSKENIHQVEVDNELAKEYLNGTLSKREFSDEILFNYLWTD